MLEAVTSLSDEERCNDRPPPKAVLGDVRLKRPPRYKKKFLGTSYAYGSTVDPTKMRHLISSRCGCSCKCFQPFHGSIHMFEEWLKQRRLMASMTKLEKDEYVSCPAVQHMLKSLSGLFTLFPFVPFYIRVYPVSLPTVRSSAG